MTSWDLMGMGPQRLNPVAVHIMVKDTVKAAGSYGKRKVSSRILQDPKMKVL